MRTAALLLLLPTIACAEFQGFEWGAAPATVAESRGEGTESGDSLMYWDVVAGEKCALQFSFNDSGLYRGVTTFVQSQTNPSAYKMLYDRLQTLLADKYGKPEFADANWNNTLFRNSPEDYGRAAAAGHVLFITQWQTETSRITLMLSGRDYKASNTIIYTSLAQADRASSELKKQQLEKL